MGSFQIMLGLTNLLPECFNVKTFDCVLRDTGISKQFFSKIYTGEVGGGL